LPNTAARNIKKGSNGTILIAASFAGVFRYDGKSFTNLTSRVGSHRFWDALEDRRGNIWFASTDSGVYYYNGKSLPTGQAGF
jgi:ligand-binding sensor domain-containing protein